MESKELILLVEDDDNLRYLAMRQLKKLGYPAHYAENGIEALRLIEEHSYDLILMDVMMPVMDGCTATKAIRDLESKDRKAHIIIAMTALNDRTKCIEAGMDDFLFKPVMLQDLDRTLKQWLPASKERVR